MTTCKDQPIGHVLTIKEEFLDEILVFCQAIRPTSFLNFSATDAPFLVNGKTVLLPDENLIIKAIDATKINTWEEFEIVLSIVVENRFMRLFQAHLDA